RLLIYKGDLKLWNKKSAKFKHVIKKSDDDKWNSDIYNNIDDDDLLQVDKIDKLEKMNDNILALTVFTNNESLIDKTQFGGLCHVKIIARKIFPKLFHQKFSNAVRAKTCSEVAEKGNICNEYHNIQFDKNLYNRLLQKIPSSENIKFTPKFLEK
ncbi:16040_t:CDS:2, partial [Dentiscutata erythropus]